VPAGIITLLEHFSIRRFDRHAEAIEDSDVTRSVNGVDHRVRLLHVNREPGVRWDVDALLLKEEATDRNSGLHRVRTSPDHLSPVSLERPCGGWRQLTWDRRSCFPRPRQPKSRRRQRVLIDGPQRKNSEQRNKDGDDRRDNPQQPFSRCHTRVNLTSFSRHEDVTNG
jgi:hypothetical protein